MMPLLTFLGRFPLILETFDTKVFNYISKNHFFFLPMWLFVLTKCWCRKIHADVSVGSCEFLLKCIFLQTGSKQVFLNFSTKTLNITFFGVCMFSVLKENYFELPKVD